MNIYIKKIARFFGAYSLYHSFLAKRRLSSTFDEHNIIFLYFLGQGKKGCMLDVGAHFGESARPFLSKGWKVFSFDPDPNQKKIAKFNELKSLFRKFSFFDLAVSNEDDKKIPFYVSSESTGISSVISFTQNHKEIKKVNTITLNSFVKRMNIDSVDFLKIDTEGNDLMVLQGLSFEKTKPEIVLCEFENSKTMHVGYTFRELGDFLVSRGYEVYLSEWYPIVRYGIKHKWRSISRYPCDVQDEKSWGNFVAVRKDSSEDFRRFLNEHALLHSDRM